MGCFDRRGRFHRRGGPLMRWRVKAGAPARRTPRRPLPPVADHTPPVPPKASALENPYTPLFRPARSWEDLRKKG